MSRRMWPYDAEKRYTVRATFKQAERWSYAASIRGLPVPVFLALAADVYADRMERQRVREERRKAREGSR